MVAELGRDALAFKEALESFTLPKDLAAPTLVLAVPTPGPPPTKPSQTSQGEHLSTCLEHLLQDPAHLGEAQAQDAMLEVFQRMAEVSDRRVVDVRRAEQ